MWPSRQPSSVENHTLMATAFTGNGGRSGRRRMCVFWNHVMMTRPPRSGQVTSLVSAWTMASMDTL